MGLEPFTCRNIQYSSDVELPVFSKNDISISSPENTDSTYIDVTFKKFGAAHYFGAPLLRLKLRLHLALINMVKYSLTLFVFIIIEVEEFAFNNCIRKTKIVATELIYEA